MANSKVVAPRSMGSKVESITLRFTWYADEDATERIDQLKALAVKDDLMIWEEVEREA